MRAYIRIGSWKAQGKLAESSDSLALKLTDTQSRSQRAFTLRLAAYEYVSREALVSTNGGVSPLGQVHPGEANFMDFPGSSGKARGRLRESSGKAQGKQTDNSGKAQGKLTENSGKDRGKLTESTDAFTLCLADTQTHSHRALALRPAYCRGV